MIFELFSYFVFLLLFVFFLSVSANFYEIPKISKSINLTWVLKLVFNLSSIISLFAIYYTHGKTIFLLYIFVFLFLLKRRFIVFKLPRTYTDLLKNSKIIFYIIPLYFIQLLLNYSFTQNNYYAISDDIYDYAATSYQLVHYGIENRTSILADFYPDLFNGLQPYHYYELWLNGIISTILSGSYVYNLVFVTYPLLLWLLVLVYFSFLEYFRINKNKGFLVLLLLAIGPIYIPLYMDVFNDGNFLNSSVFPITGFVKQTLPYSYFGQKHLPIYIFSGLFVMGLLKTNFRILYFSFSLLILSSVGIFPALFSALFFYFIYIYFKKKKTIKHIAPFFITVFIFLIIVKFFGFQVAEEMSKKTSYIPHFLKHLNLKGELLRVVEKVLYPVIWFSILYLPYILIVRYFNVESKKYVKLFLPLILFTYLGGVSITVFLYGINSDQFITNVLPLYNLFLMILFLNLISCLQISEQANKIKSVVFLFVIIGFVNFKQLVVHHFSPGFKNINNTLYTPSIQQKVLQSLKDHPSNYIAYLLPNSILSSTPPVIQYPYLPAKFCMLANYFNFVDVNYPFYHYSYNTSSHVFSPKNQLKYYIPKNQLNYQNFERYQIDFLKKYQFKWVFCARNAKLPHYLFSFVKQKITDPKSGENYYRIGFTH